MKYFRDLLRDISCSRSLTLMSIHPEISSSLLKMTPALGWATMFQDGDNLQRNLGTLEKLIGRKPEIQLRNNSCLWNRGALAIKQSEEGHAGISSLGKALRPGRQQIESQPDV